MTLKKMETDTQGNQKKKKENVKALLFNIYTIPFGFQTRSLSKNFLSILVDPKV